MEPHREAQAAGDWGIDVPRLAGATLLDEAGVEHRAGGLWARGPTVLVFVRHFGWMFCREQTVQVQRATPELEDAGASVAVIGNGAPRYASEFREVTDYTGTLYTDPSREAYRACALVRGVRATFNLASVRDAFRTMSNGFRQGRTRGDPWQQGGAVVMAPPNEVLAVQRSERAGEHAVMSELIELLRMRSIDDAWV